MSTETTISTHPLSAPSLEPLESLPRVERERLLEIERKYRQYDEVIQTMVREFQERVDQRGTPGFEVDHALREAHSQRTWAARLIRQIEDNDLPALRSIAPMNPAVSTILTTAGALLDAADLTYASFERCGELARQLYEVARRVDEAEQIQVRATEESWMAHTPSGLPGALFLLGEAIEILDEAERGLCAGDPSLAARRTHIITLRGELETALTAVCERGAQENLQSNCEAVVDEYVDALRSAVPAAGERLAAAIAGATGDRTEAQAEIRRRADLLDHRLADAIASARDGFDQLVAKHDAREVDALPSVGDPALREVWALARLGWLGSSHRDQFVTLAGQPCWLAYDPAVRNTLVEETTCLDRIHEQIVAAVLSARGLADVPAARAFLCEQPELLCEVVGTRMYTPQLDVRSSDGIKIGTVAGQPFQVPSLLIRALISTRYRITPAAGAILETIELDDLRG